MLKTSPTFSLDPIYLQEQNIAPDGYQQQDLESKGFFPEVSIQDFPIRGQKVALCIKRRRWTVKSNGEVELQ